MPESFSGLVAVSERIIHHQTILSTRTGREAKEKTEKKHGLIALF